MLPLARAPPDASWLHSHRYYTRAFLAASAALDGWMAGWLAGTLDVQQGRMQGLQVHYRERFRLGGQ